MLNRFNLVQWMERERRERTVVGHVLLLHGHPHKVRDSSFGKAIAKRSTSWSVSLDAQGCQRHSMSKKTLVRSASGRSLEIKGESMGRVGWR